jgi:hypothetical protein
MEQIRVLIKRVRDTIAHWSPTPGKRHNGSACGHRDPLLHTGPRTPPE